jgi:hypothetical protein
MCRGRGASPERVILIDWGLGNKVRNLAPIPKHATTIITSRTLCIKWWIFTISYPDLIKLPYFVDLTQRWDRGWKEAQRQGDFKFPKTLHHNFPKPLHASRVCLTFTNWSWLITNVNRLATIRFWRMKVTRCFANFLADYLLQSFGGDSLHPSQLRYDLLQSRSSQYCTNTWVGSVVTCWILFYFLIFSLTFRFKILRFPRY